LKIAASFSARANERGCERSDARYMLVIQGQAGRQSTAANFARMSRSNGASNASDISLVKARSGQSVPP